MVILKYLSTISRAASSIISVGYCWPKDVSVILHLLYTSFYHPIKKFVKKASKSTLPKKSFKLFFDYVKYVFLMKLVDAIRPFAKLRSSKVCQDVLSLEKRIAMTLYYLKDQGSMKMTANTFGIARCSWNMPNIKWKHWSKNS